MVCAPDRSIHCNYSIKLLIFLEKIQKKYKFDVASQQYCVIIIIVLKTDKLWKYKCILIHLKEERRKNFD